MTEHPDDRNVTDRRTVLAFAGTSIGGASLGLGGLVSFDTEEFVAKQDGNCYPLKPLSGDAPVEELYDWNRSTFSSTGTVDLQGEDTTILFLYDGPDGLSLVIVHDRFVEAADPDGDAGGGSVSFDFRKLPMDGEWVVQDDLYDGPQNYDRWSQYGRRASVDWTWAGNRTDGGAFRGLDVSEPRELELTIVPAFNEDAALYGEYYEGRITDWQVLSGSRENPKRHSLALDEEVIITRDTCGVLDGLVDVTGTGTEEGPGQGPTGEREGERDAEDESGRGPPSDEGGPPFDDDGQPGRGRGRGEDQGEGPSRGRSRGEGDERESEENDGLVTVDIGD